jgi:hypothetical protein
MTQQQIINAGIDYTMSTCPVCMGGAAFEDKVRQYNRNTSFEAGAKWAKDRLIEEACELLVRMIWEVTYEDLEGNSVQNYDKMEFIETLKKVLNE